MWMQQNIAKELGRDLQSVVELYKALECCFGGCKAAVGALVA